jgi:membrane protein
VVVAPRSTATDGELQLTLLREILPGALVTALLFQIGSQLTGLYIGKQGVASTFGAAASVVVVLIWIYYSAQIILFGAEFTRAYAQQQPA